MSIRITAGPGVECVFPGEITAGLTVGDVLDNERVDSFIQKPDNCGVRVNNIEATDSSSVRDGDTIYVYPKADDKG